MKPSSFGGAVSSSTGRCWLSPTSPSTFTPTPWSRRVGGRPSCWERNNTSCWATTGRCSADSRTYGPVDRKQIKRRVPLPEDFVCAYFAPYTLPDYGKTLIRPVATRTAGASPPLAEKPSEQDARQLDALRPRAAARGSLARGFFRRRIRGGRWRAGFRRLAPAWRATPPALPAARPSWVSSMRRRTSWSISSKGRKPTAAIRSWGIPLW